ncbi:hypothetical protein [Paenibacillus herberti]|uniref:Uncharacterized protein n=1 Tax=Paenibacillus herberti TaxID=1619309 RepID=A0A229P596_9BACL|nr:hypothetical protein [Paenibacillus herberti]OXM17114.1 hypothetical protein CGZ75_10955 [Paenibacillus herberti]
MLKPQGNGRVPLPGAKRFIPGKAEPIKKQPAPFAKHPAPAVKGRRIDKENPASAKSSVNKRRRAALPKRAASDFGKRPEPDTTGAATSKQGSGGRAQRHELGGSPAGLARRGRLIERRSAINPGWPPLGSWAFPAGCGVVLTGTNRAALEQGANWLAGIGCRSMVLVEYGAQAALMNPVENADGWRMIEANDGPESEVLLRMIQLAREEPGDTLEANMLYGNTALQRVQLRLAGGDAALARAIGAAATVRLRPAAVLFANAESAAQPTGGAMLRSVLSACLPGRAAAALQDNGACRKPFSQWSDSTRLNAFLHWSLGGEKRTAVSFQQVPFALNESALQLLADGSLASPPHALASLLVGGGVAVPVMMKPSGKGEPNDQAVYAQAIYSAVRSPRQGYPDLSRDREAAARM